MKTHFLLAILHCTVLLTAQSLQHPDIRYSRISIPDPDLSTISRIQQAGIDLHCGGHLSTENDLHTLQLECSEQELAALRHAEVDYTVLIADVEYFYAQRASAHLNEAREALDQHKRNIVQRGLMKDQGTLDSPVPAHFFLGELGGFLYYEQILAALDSMALLYPELITVKRSVSDSILTRQGRPVYWVKISDHPDIDASEPEVLYTGITHAREPASAMSLLYYMWYLLENYATHPEIQRLVDHTELFFIPVLNPDGYVYNETIAPEGGGMWRKNLCDNDTNAIIDGMDGVDLNRNFGYLWGYDDMGSSPYPSVSTYRGEAPFSEPETRMLRDFVLQREFVTAMNDHSYGNDLYHAWEHGPSPLPEHDLLYRLSDLMTWNNRYLFGESYNTYWLGAINGGANDWFFGEQQEKPRIYSWLPEIGAEFWPDPLDIIKICQNQLEPHLMLAQIAGQHATMHDLNSPSLTYGLNTLSFRIENLGFKKGNFRLILIPHDERISEYFIQDKGVMHFSDMLEEQEITLQIYVDPGIPDGSTLTFDLVLEGEDYVIDQMSLAYYIRPIVAFSPLAGADVIDQWQSEVWGSTIDPVDSSAQWITDTPEGDQLNDFTTIQLRDAIHLNDVSWAKATFKAHWSIETTYDFVQLQARIPNGPWTPLSGKYTKAGAPGFAIDIPSPHAGQPLGEPVYDGRQQSWVQEVIDLSEFVGFDSILLRFVAWSGAKVSLVVEDGFYFRDFAIYTSRKVHCADQEQNFDEEGIDCGGSHCTPCPTCADGIQNGDEEAVDCGGACTPCPSCMDGIQNNDEEEIDCGGSNCAPCPSCADGIQNADEEGIDCGGTNCTPCPTCVDGIQNADEDGIDCGGSACIPCPSCIDGLQNGDETDVDCGGICAPCAPTCSDGIMNGDEEDVDCGGSCPDICKTYCCERENKIWYADGLRVTIAPNPVNDQLILTLSRSEVEELSFALVWQIRTLTGIEILHGVLADEGETRVDVSGLVPQLYLISISELNGRMIVSRFLKT